MSARVIVTSQPDVACFVCGRRLLRGEHPDIFLVDSTPQPVCELCVPRAAHQGWPRGSDSEAISEPERAVRHGPGLFSRLRRGTAPAPRRRITGQAGAPRTAAGAHSDEAQAAQSASMITAPDPNAAAAQDGVAAHTGGDRATAAIEFALQAFNRGGYPRRVAGLARSLGLPEVSAAYDEDLDIVVIVIAWELCWYRYRVDVYDEQPQARMIEEGRTLGQLHRADRLRNVQADDLGGLSLVVAAV